MEDSNRSEIYDLAHRCDEMFERIVARNQARGTDVTRVLHERFGQWASHLGVFAWDAGRPNVSLDARLRFSESLRSLVLRYLDIAESNLEDSVCPCAAPLVLLLALALALSRLVFFTRRTWQ